VKAMTEIQLNASLKGTVKDPMRMLKTNLSIRCFVTVCALLLAAGTPNAKAEVPGPHPGYMHAIRNLRQARGFLETNFSNPGQAQAAGAAIHEIDAAIADLKQAAATNGANVGEVPPANGNLPPEGRFHQVAGLLHQARSDAGGQESDPVAVPAQGRALKHIDEASAIIAKVM